MLATLLLSQGVPMLLAGDERNRTQRGNNNAYCQDSAISWLDWRLDDTARDLLDFTRRLLVLRQQHPVLRRPSFFQGRPIRDDVLLLLNAAPADAAFALPGAAGTTWDALIDTARPKGELPTCASGDGYPLQGRSVALLRQRE